MGKRTRNATATVSPPNAAVDPASAASSASSVPTPSEGAPITTDLQSVEPRDDSDPDDDDQNPPLSDDDEQGSTPSDKQEPSAQEMYEELLMGGYYDQLVKTIRSMGTRALVNNTYGRKGTFIRRTGWKSGYTYESTTTAERGRDKKMVVVGETCSMDQGTRLSALGCHWPGSLAKGNNYVKNNTTIKEGILLRNISLAERHEDMSDLYADQFVPLYQAKNAEEEEDASYGKYYDVKHCVVNPEQDNHNKLLSLHFKKKYMARTGSKAVVAANGTMKAQDCRKAEKMAKAAASRSARRDGGAGFPKPPYKVGQLYDPRHLSDYGGVLVEGHTNWMVQQDVRNIDGSLVPPWEMYDALKPGTLIMATVTPTVFIIGDGGGEPTGVEYRDDANNGKRKRGPQKIYQLIIESLKILADSGEAVEDRYPHPGFESSRHEECSATEEDPLEECVPFKRRRLAPSGPAAEGYSVSSSGTEPEYAQAGSSGSSSQNNAGDAEDNLEEEFLEYHDEDGPGDGMQTE